MRITVIAVTVAAGLLVSAAPATTADTVPFRAEASFTFAIAADPAPCAVVRVEVEATGHATQLGRFTAGEYYHCVDPSDPLAFSGGRYTFVAADGSSISGGYSGRFVPTADPSVLAVNGMFTITGGTGRFDGATGGGTASGTGGAGGGVLVLDGRISRQGG